MYKMLKKRNFLLLFRLVVCYHLLQLPGFGNCQDEMLVSTEKTDMQVHNKSYTFRQAVEDCRSRDEELLSVTSKEIHAALLSHMLMSRIENNGFSPQSLWIKNSAYSTKFATPTVQNIPNPEYILVLSGYCCMSDQKTENYTCENNTGLSLQKSQQTGSVQPANPSDRNSFVCKRNTWLHEFEQVGIENPHASVEKIIERVESVFRGCPNFGVTRVIPIQNKSAEASVRYYVRTVNSGTTSRDLLDCCKGPSNDADGIDCGTPLMETKCPETKQVKNFTFPEAMLSQTSYSHQYCPDNPGNISLASIRCTLATKQTAYGALREPQFDLSSIAVVNCSQTLNEVLKKSKSLLSNEAQVDEKVIGNVVSDLQLLSRSKNFNVNDANVTAQTITAITELVAKNDLDVSENVFASLVESSSNVNQAFKSGEGSASEQDTNIRHGVIKGLINATKKVDKNITNSTFDSPSIHLQIQKVEYEDEKSEKPLTFEPIRRDATTQSSVFVNVPKEAIDKASQGLRNSSISSILRIVFAQVDGNGLYPTDQSNKSINQVIIVEFHAVGDKEDAHPVEDLVKPVIIKHRNHNLSYGEHLKNQEQEDKPTISVINYQCVAFDEKNNDWSPEGCCLDVSVKDHPTCQCYHLSALSLLATDKEVPKDFVLEVFSDVGCGLTMGFLLITVILHLLNKKLRKQLSDQMQINMFVCLLIGYTTFLFGVDNIENDLSCTVTSFVLHFSFLAAFFWSAVYSRKLYTQIAKQSIHITSEYHILKAAAFAYLTPLVIVTTAAVFSWIVVDPYIQDINLCPDTLKEDHMYYQWKYRSNKACWIHKEILYYTFLLIVGLILVFNVVVTSIVCKRILFSKNQPQSNKPKITKTQQLVMICTLSVVLGLTWLVGFLFLLSDDQTYLRIVNWIFVLLNAFSGIYLFLVTCVKRQEMRKFWLRPLRECVSYMQNKIAMSGSSGEHSNAQNSNLTTAQADRRNQTLGTQLD